MKRYDKESYSDFDNYYLLRNIELVIYIKQEAG